MITPSSTLAAHTLRLGATGSLLLGAAGTASAAVATNGTIRFNDNPGLTTTGTPGDQVLFDLNADGTGDFFITTLNGKAPSRFLPEGIPVAGAFAPNTLLTSFVSNGQELDVYTTGLTPGSTVGPDSIFLPPGSGTANAAAPIYVDDSYFGFSFLDGSTRVYGWTHFAFSAPTLTTPSLTLLAWAYDTSGALIIVGSTTPIPEASTTTLAMGAAALLAGSAAAWRRRQARLPAAA